MAYSIQSWKPPATLTFWQYWKRYLTWMEKHKHPDLARSNYYADKLREEIEHKKSIKL